MKIFKIILFMLIVFLSCQGATKGEDDTSEGPRLSKEMALFLQERILSHSTLDFLKGRYSIAARELEVWRQVGCPTEILQCLEDQKKFLQTQIERFTPKPI